MNIFLLVRALMLRENVTCCEKVNKYDEVAYFSAQSHSIFDIKC